jgi:DNA-binding NtrC family response regulator
MAEVYWTPGMSLDELEKIAIKKAMSFYDHNKDKTSTSLKIARRTLDNKLAKYDKEELEQRARLKMEQEQAHKDLILMRG